MCNFQRIRLSTCHAKLSVSSIGREGDGARELLAGQRVSAGCLLRPHERSVHGGCGGPVLNVEAAHRGRVVWVVVRCLRVVGRRRDQAGPHGAPAEGRAGRRASATGPAQTRGQRMSGPTSVPLQCASATTAHLRRGSRRRRRIPGTGAICCPASADGR